MDTDILASTEPQPVVPDVSFQPEILDHYRLAGPLIEATFGGEPIVYASLPQGFEGKPHFVITDVPLSADKLLLLVHREYAVEFQSWAPLATDEDRLRFARILMTRTHHDAFHLVREGAERLRRQLHLDGLDAAVVLDGYHGVALWIPLADAPHAAVARAWLHKFCARAVADAPDLFSTKPLTHEPDLVHLHVSSNARHLHSALPYSLRGQPDFPVVTPVTWDDFAGMPVPMLARWFAKHIADHGDIFAAEVKRIGDQRLSEFPRPFVMVPDLPDLESLDSATRGHVIIAAIAILEDGKTRTAEQILAEALARQLVPPMTTKKYVYSALIEYIARWLGHGRKPQIVQDAERSFRINEPPDDWPDIVPFPAPAPDAAVDALVARLEATSVGHDPAAFEIACCDAFAHLGFRTRHLGGYENPDGVADANLGPLGYRVMLECKSAPLHGKPSHPEGGIVVQPNVAEAAKFVAAFDADYAVLIGPDFKNEIELLNELKTHKVTAFTVSDLVTLLHLRANALEVRALLQPGFVMDAIADLVWERRHGRVKRIATVAALVQREGWAAQCAPNGDGRLTRGESPHLTVDAAMLLVDQALRAAGSTQTCTREEVEAALAHLTDPLIGSAVWLDPSRTAIAVISAPMVSDKSQGRLAAASHPSTEALGGIML